MNAEQLLSMAFPNETGAEGPRGPIREDAPRLELVKRPDPVTAWAALQRMIRTTPGLELGTDGQGGVWLREPDEWELFEEAQRLFLEAMPEIAKTLNRPPAPKRRTGLPIRITPPMVRVWRAARAWLFVHLDALTAAGWTNKRLFAAGRTSFPHGEWGVAWLSNWIKPGVEVRMNGPAIVWTWREGPITRTQTAKP